MNTDHRTPGHLCSSVVHLWLCFRAEKRRDDFARDTGVPQRPEDDAYRHVAAQRLGIAVDDVRDQADGRILVERHEAGHEGQAVGDLWDPGVTDDRPGEQAAATADLGPAQVVAAAMTAGGLRVPHQPPTRCAARDHQRAARRPVPERPGRLPRHVGKRKIGPHHCRPRISVLACGPVYPPYTPTAASGTWAAAVRRSWRTISTTCAIPST